MTETEDSVTRKPAPLALRNEDDFLQEQAQLMRASVYELLANLLAREPDQALIAALAGIEEVDTDEGQVAMGWELLRQAAGKEDAATMAASIKDEYFNLFLGVGRGELVPFGSWYLTGFLMEKPVSVLRADLAALGIERQDGITDTEDHIAALCDTMAIIIRSGDEIEFARQQQFFTDHIDPWAVRFFTDLQSAKSASFYRSVGFFGESFIEFEQQLLSMKV
ncbi:MAG: molecular chaperone TorD family protein [Gammaproteobacteria bacterium]|nr:molecular chaperone TorD family protein [Gammaproteobacteria bacterium]